MTVPVPRPSTTVLLVRDGADGLEVLMVVRNAQSHFASALVFPGGVIDAEDADTAWLDLIDGAADLEEVERTRRIAGFRELYEETGVLLLEAPKRRPEAGGEGASFLEVVRQSGGRLDLAAMVTFAHWVTPESAPKRYDTHFRLCWRTTEMTAISDGRETVAAEWLRPADAISLGASGERNLLFPTKCQLDLLAQADTVEAAVAAARTRRIVPVTPSLDRRPEGTFLSIPEETGYPVREFFMGARPA
ncbi:NUDIX domain-containing protein [Phenylobacterium sp. LjRoot225]|uniref:NUDIX hydrolase n=1 Tax=Phenylobacterium sp. LjRoot225 TaxID=3342285 RepID=UPI003ECF7FCA